jgi:hypothetical protein
MSEATIGSALIGCQFGVFCTMSVFLPRLLHAEVFAITECQIRACDQKLCKWLAELSLISGNIFNSDQGNFKVTVINHVVFDASLDISIAIPCVFGS